jgi:hypothetical protein
LPPGSGSEAGDLVFDRSFALAGNFERIDGDPRPISEIPKGELLRGFGEEGLGG